MKTLRQFSSKAAPLAVAVSLAFFAGNLRAFGPGAFGNGNSASNGGTLGGTFAAGGARGGRTTSGNTGAFSASSGGRGGVSISNNAPRTSPGTSTRGGAPSGLSQPYRNVLNGPSPYTVARPAASQSVTRPNNAWSGTAVNPARNPNGRNANRFTGQTLYPGTYGSNLPTANLWTDRGNSNRGNRGGRPYYRLPGRYYYHPYAYGPGYAPYIGYYTGGSSYYEGAYPYYNDVPAAEYSTGVVTPQDADPGQDADNQPQPDPDRQPQPTPAPQNPNTNNATQGTIPNNGPDSLVEAVQQELIRRGYFGGKVDAMFTPETKEGLRKFQADHHLAETGLINEATLHALQLD